jgi:xylan 1,4-beta-xylosidase
VYATGQDNCKIRLLFDETDVTGSVDLPATGGYDQWRSFVIKDLDLKQGFHTLRLEVLEGSFHFYSAEIVKANNIPFDQTVSFDGSFGTGWKYDDGEWKILDKNAVIDGFGKRTYGSDAWCDYSVETDIMFTRSMNAGLIFRVNNPALGGAGNDPALGTDFLQGYFVGFNFGTVVLGKHNYGWESLATAPKSLSMNTWYHLRVVAEGDRIRVYVEDMTQPIIDFTDPVPLINGMAGLRSYNTGVRFDNFHVTSSLLTTPVTEAPDDTDESQFQIYPNPAGDYATLDFGVKGTREILISNMSGAVVKSLASVDETIDLNTRDLSPGIYMIKVKCRKSVKTRKLILQ